MCEGTHADAQVVGHVAWLAPVLIAGELDMCMPPPSSPDPPALTPTSAKSARVHAGAVAGEATRSASTSPAAADACLMPAEARAPLPLPEVDDREGRRAAAAALQQHTAPPKQRQRSSSEGSESTSRTQVVLLTLLRLLESWMAHVVKWVGLQSLRQIIWCAVRCKSLTCMPAG